MELSELLQRQRNFVRDGHTRSAASRISNLKRLKSLIKRRESDILDALFTDLGKCEHEGFGSEIAIVIEEINHAIKNLKDWMRPSYHSAPLALQPARGEIHYEPYGSSLIIAPWNYPFQLLFSPFVASLAAGNASVLKPSEVSSASEKLAISLIHEEFPNELVQVVPGGVEVTQELLALPFDFICFTGSTQVGRIVMEAAAKNLTPVCLELGGKSPCLIDENCDLDMAAKRVVWGKFLNSGQTCVAPDYVYVPETLHEEFLEKVKKWISIFYGPSPLHSPDLSKIINETHFQRLSQLLDGLDILIGGQCDQKGLRIEPTVVGGIEDSQPIMQEEIFGPILPVLTYQHWHEALAAIHKRPKPLAFYLFSNSKAKIKQVEQEIPFGGGCINDCLVHLAAPNLPFGGVGASGMGAYHGHHGFLQFSHSKSLLKRSNWLDFSLRYPPYTSRKVKWLRRIIGR